MKATLQPLPHESELIPHPEPTSAEAEMSVISSAPSATSYHWLSVYSELFKTRLTFLVLLTTLVGFYMGVNSQVNYLLMFHTLLGTGLLAAGASALNQLLEREYDAQMKRTKSRPLPCGHLKPGTVLWIGCLGGVVGPGYLWLTVNPITSVVGAVSLLSYVFVYTPLKRLSWLNTAVGAVPGALPPLMGWTAATGSLIGSGWLLFAILAVWQIPHFFAIAWIYRDEYTQAGFKMLPSLDPTGKRTGRQTVGFSAVLLSLSVCPFFFRMAGATYLFGAVLLGTGFLWFSFRFASELKVARARQLFLASILYLPLLLGLLVLDKVK